MWTNWKFSWKEVRSEWYCYSISLESLVPYYFSLHFSWLNFYSKGRKIHTKLNKSWAKTLIKTADLLKAGSWSKKPKSLGVSFSLRWGSAVAGNMVFLFLTAKGTDLRFELQLSAVTEFSCAPTVKSCCLSEYKKKYPEWPTVTCNLLRYCIGDFKKFNSPEF